MNAIQEKTLFHLTGVRDLSLVSEDRLKQLISDHPYFAPLQLMLAIKLKENNGAEFMSQARKTSLYFTNPYWLHFLLTETGETNEIKPRIQPEVIISTKFDRSVEVIEQADTIASKKNTASTFIQHSNQQGFEIPTVESVKELMRGIDSTNNRQENIFPESSEMDLEELPLPEEDTDYSSAIEDEDAVAELSNAKISSLLSNQLADFKKPVEADADLEIAQDPMHTIDYFASQGIKIDLSKIPQDKLTTKLRRFTDWLKYMKSENPNPVDLGTHQDLEDAVELIAITSNEEKEIVTETMADVLQKQGQVDKAIQLYIKLSFLNPEKSAYFAAKIQQLKGIQ